MAWLPECQVAQSGPIVRIRGDPLLQRAQPFARLVRVQVQPGRDRQDRGHERVGLLPRIPHASTRSGIRIRSNLNIRSCRARSGRGSVRRVATCSSSRYSCQACTSDPSAMVSRRCDQHPIEPCRGRREVQAEPQVTCLGHQIQRRRIARRIGHPVQLLQRLGQVPRPRRLQRGPEPGRQAHADIHHGLGSGQGLGAQQIAGTLPGGPGSLPASLPGSRAVRPAGNGAGEASRAACRPVQAVRSEPSGRSAASASSTKPAQSSEAGHGAMPARKSNRPSRRQAPANRRVSPVTWETARTPASTRPSSRTIGSGVSDHRYRTWDVTSRPSTPSSRSRATASSTRTRDGRTWRSQMWRPSLWAGTLLCARSRCSSSTASRSSGAKGSASSMARAA